MIPCLILGDSLAVGVGQARPECTAVAEVGINSARYLQTMHALPHARIVVISLGVNDSADIDTEHNLRRLRHGIAASVVYWLRPGIHPVARQAVLGIAKEFRDRVIEVAPLAGADRIHPDRAGYAVLASLTRREEGGLAAGRTAYNDMPAPGRVYHSFPAHDPAYRDFADVRVPGVKIWRGPDNLNGLPVPPMPPKRPR